MKKALLAELKKLGAKTEDLGSPVLEAAVNGRSDWLGCSLPSLDQPGGAALSLADTHTLLGDSQKLASLGRNRQGIERLCRLLGIENFSYIGGFWNYFPTTSDNTWVHQPLILTNYSLWWKFNYWKRGWGFVDPAIKNTIRNRGALHWKTHDFAGEATEFRYFALKEGILEGCTVPVFRTGSEIALLTLVPGAGCVLSAEDLYDYRFNLAAFAQEFHETVFEEHLIKVRDSIKFTKREKQVLRLIVEGLKNVQIETRLGLSESTVKMHQESIRRKLNVPSRNDIATHAIALGWTALAKDLTIPSVSN